MKFLIGTWETQYSNSYFNQLDLEKLKVHMHKAFVNFWIIFDVKTPLWDE